MLPLAIEDIKTRVLIGQSENGGKAEEIKIGMLTMDEHGELKIIEEKSKKSTALTVASNQHNQLLAQYFEDDFEEVNEEPNDYVKNLVVRTFVPLPTVIEEIDVERS